MGSQGIMMGLCAFAVEFGFKILEREKKGCVHLSISLGSYDGVS